MLLLNQLGSFMEVKESEAPSQCRKHLDSLLIAAAAQHCSANEEIGGWQSMRHYVGALGCLHLLKIPFSAHLLKSCSLLRFSHWQQL